MLTKQIYLWYYSTKKGYTFMNDTIVCPVCGKHMFAEKNDYDICPFCGWENESNFDFLVGVNGLTLADYKTRYQMYLTVNPDYRWKKDGFPVLTKDEKCQYFHTFSLANRKDIEDSLRCGCFFCLNIFDKTQITEWLHDKNGETAICPHCGVDAVLPDSKVKLSKPVLEEMYHVWFS